MVDFSNVLNMNVDDAEAPKPLPIGTYKARIGSYEFGESSMKKTPLVRVFYVPVEPMSDVDEDELEAVQQTVEGDIAKKSLSNDFYLTPNAIFMLRRHMEDVLGMTTSGRTFNETIPEMVNQDCVLTVDHGTSQRTGNVYAYISDFAAIDDLEE